VDWGSESLTNGSGSGRPKNMRPLEVNDMLAKNRRKKTEDESIFRKADL
jgi:hypothetical protein